MPLVPAFQLHLKDPILGGLATVGKYDGKHPCLTAATSGGKIFIHNPYQQEANGSNVKYLNINKKISSVARGELDPQTGRDILLVGTQTDLLAYDVEENQDHFFKDVPDGVNSMLCGKVGNIEMPLAVVGGNCSIQGFDMEGTELFWTVTGDNVTALALADLNNDGKNELIVGSDDFEIRVFQNEEVISEITESERVVGLAPLVGFRYAYALGNGTIGTYDKTTRAWRVKSKNEVMAISSYDLDGDGVPEVITGWSSGKMEVRHERTGEVVYRDNFSSPVSALVKADYRKDGGEDIICCSLDGEVRGYRPVDKEASKPNADLLDRDTSEETLVELNQRRQDLLFELKSYEANVRDMESVNGGQTEVSGAIPPDTHVQSSLEMNPDIQCGELVLTTNNDTVIKAVIMFAEQIFEEESRFTHFSNPQRTARIPLKPPKDVSCDMIIKVMVSSRTSPVYHVFELDFKLPKFCMYVPVPDNVPEPISSVQFQLKDRPSRVALWLDSAFSTNLSGGDAGVHLDSISAAFVSLRDAKPLIIKMNSDNVVTIKMDSMETAGDVIQDMVTHLGVNELESTADFPYEMEAFRSILLKVDEHNAVRLKLTADVADSSNVVKMFVIKAEDSRILRNMNLMRRMYSQLFDLNRELIMEHTKRATNHQELLLALKDVNQMIQKAARLRAGSAKTRVISSCRNAIKSNNIHALFKIMGYGQE